MKRIRSCRGMMGIARRSMKVFLTACMFLAATWAAAEPEVSSPTSGTKPSLSEALAKLKVPPDWFQTIPVNYDTTKPWGEARLEVRRLLGLGGDHLREAMKLTYLYAQKKDIGNGHELPMYLFMGGEIAWAIPEYERFLAATTDPDTHGFLCLAACFRHFGEYNKAIEVLNKALTRLPPPPWRIAREADVADALGDTYGEMGLFERAKEHYRKAIALYPTSNQPFGRQELHKRTAKVQAKMDFLDHQTIEAGDFRDGVFSAKSFGYADDIEVFVTIKDHKIADIQLKHQEKIDLGACEITPQRIIAKQSLKVDGITGATVTHQAIIDGVFQALMKATMK